MGRGVRYEAKAGKNGEKGSNPFKARRKSRDVGEAQEERNETPEWEHGDRKHETISSSLQDISQCEHADLKGSWWPQIDV